MAMNVTVPDVCMTQWNDFTVIRYLVHKSTPVAKESIHVCIETAVRGFTLAELVNFPNIGSCEMQLLPFPCIVLSKLCLAISWFTCATHL